MSLLSSSLLSTRQRLSSSLSKFSFTLLFILFCCFTSKHWALYKPGSIIGMWTICFYRVHICVCVCVFAFFFLYLYVIELNLMVCYSLFVCVFHLFMPSHSPLYDNCIWLCVSAYVSLCVQKAYMNMCVCVSYYFSFWVILPFFFLTADVYDFVFAVVAVSDASSLYSVIILAFFPIDMYLCILCMQAPNLSSRVLFFFFTFFFLFCFYEFGICRLFFIFCALERY